MTEFCDCGRGIAYKTIEIDGEKSVVCYKCYLQWKYGDYEQMLDKKHWKRLYKKRDNYEKFC